MKLALHAIFMLALIGLTAPQFVACQREGVSAQSTPVALIELAPAAIGHAEQLLASYENVRARLAKDDAAGISDDVQRLETAATQAVSSAGASAAAQEKFRAVGTAAKALRGMNKTNADEVRKSFGELSRHVVALVASVPRLQQGRFVFSCPMAQGYQKWVQTKAQLDNPYMGTRMLACGSASDWS